MVNDADGYQAYYSGKLWSLLPQIYRMYDATSVFDPNLQNQPNGPLRELVNRIGAQAATLRRSIDRMWEDQSIESCDDWVIPYIGAVVAANLVSSLDPRSQRLAVAKTIYYRRRRGTIPLLEEISVDITGWNARVVELYRRLGRTRHLLDPTIRPPKGQFPAASITESTLPVAAGLIGLHTRTPAGGFADLRNDYGASRAGTAFDEFSYTMDARAGHEKTGWYNIPNLGAFLWRLGSFMVQGATPVAAADGKNQYTFDPTGRDVPLFAAPVQAYGTTWKPRAEYQMPGPIDTRLLKVALSKLYAAQNSKDGSLLPNSIGFYKGAPSISTLVPVDQVTAGLADTAHYSIDPEQGHFTVPEASRPGQLAVGYCYGFSSMIGAGTFDRRMPGANRAAILPLAPIAQGGGNISMVSFGTLEIGDSLTYSSMPDCTINGTNRLTIQASNLQRPLLRFPPAARGAPRWTFTGTMVNGCASTLVLDGLFITGANVVLEGTFDSVVLSTCTLDPGAWSRNGPQLAIDGQPLIPCHVWVSGTVRSLMIDRCILGPIAIVRSGSIGRIQITNSIVQAVAPRDSVSIMTGATAICGCTILGRAAFRQLEASNSIFHGVVTVSDNQQGCLRFSAFTRGSVLPTQYECVELEPRQALFASTAFGQPHYAQLVSSADSRVRAGAANGSEMGAFSRDNNPLKERSLLIKYNEFMPLGLTPILISAA